MEKLSGKKRVRDDRGELRVVSLCHRKHDHVFVREKGYRVRCIFGIYYSKRIMDGDERVVENITRETKFKTFDNTSDLYYIFAWIYVVSYK